MAVHRVALMSCYQIPMLYPYLRSNWLSETVILEFANFIFET